MHPRSILIAASFGLVAALAVGCSSDVHVYRNALTGAECTPDPSTFIPPDRGQSGDHQPSGDHGQGNTSPTGIPGDNLDDIRSGKADCLGDGDSGQGNDTPDCQVAGCDSKLCCDGDMVPPDDGSGDDGPDAGSDDGNDTGGGDGSGGDGSGADAGTVD
jgi:hypothetical protein